MGCTSCSVTKNGVPQGCGDKGHCTSGSCNKKNTFDWLTTLDLHDPLEFKIVEVSFKKGARKGFYINPEMTQAITGDVVVVENSTGYDVGRISLSGDLVRMQMKKVKHDEENVIHKVIRIANNRDLEKLSEARGMEKRTMIKARKIAQTLDLKMKVGEVEYQGDKRKATFYYTADGRVDFRELVRMYAKEFRVKIEMKQIGSRQESSIIGGIGTCGRELCCSTWKSDFQSVNTAAARYQNLAINQTKLTGQCGRLKCCLNYELDTYMDALKDFPKNADTIKLDKGYANLIKTDIFKGIMYYSVQKDNIRGPLLPLSKERVKKLLQLNKEGVAIKDINNFEALMTKPEINEDNIELDFADVTGEIELPELKRRKKRRNKKKSNKPQGSNQNRRSSKPKKDKKPQGKASDKPKNKSGKNQASERRNSKNKPAGNKPSENKSRNKPSGNKPSGNKPADNRPTSNKPAGNNKTDKPVSWDKPNEKSSNTPKKKNRSWDKKKSDKNKNDQ